VAEPLQALLAQLAATLLVWQMDASCCWADACDFSRRLGVLLSCSKEKPGRYLRASGRSSPESSPCVNGIEDVGSWVPSGHDKTMTTFSICSIPLRRVAALLHCTVLRLVGARVPGFEEQPSRGAESMVEASVSVYCS
jgi:hypothetical protein